MRNCRGGNSPARSFTSSIETDALYPDSEYGYLRHDVFLGFRKTYKGWAKAQRYSTVREMSGKKGVARQGLGVLLTSSDSTKFKYPVQFLKSQRVFCAWYLVCQILT
jgi:hypothetical protein